MKGLKKAKKIMLTVGAGIVGTIGIPLVSAASAIANDTLEGLPQIGSDVGSFLTNLAPGVGAFIIIMGVFGGVAGIVYAIVGVVKSKIRV